VLVYLYYLQKKMLFICHLFFSPQCLARVKRSAGCNVDHTVHGANLCNVDHTVHGANLCNVDHTVHGANLCNVDHTVHGANLCNVDHTVHGANLFVSLLHSAIFLMRSLVMKLHVFFLVL